MDVLYVLAVWLHIWTMAFWVGAMFFGDPESTRFFSKLFEHKLKGVGWFAQPILIVTGIFLLYYRGITIGQVFSADFLASSWGRTFWIKMFFVLTLVTLQLTTGNKPSKLIFAYVLVAFATVGMGVLLVRPIF